MGTVHISVGDVNSRSDTGASMPVRKSVPKASQTISPTTSNLVSSISASEPVGDFWSVTAADVNAWVAFGISPDASADPRELVLAGQTRDFSASTAGEKVAVKLA